MENKELLTIRQTAKKGPLNERILREMRSKGVLPGVIVGNRFYVNYRVLLKLIDEKSKKGDVLV